MSDKFIEYNQVSIMGKIDTGFTFSHQVFGEGFYTMEILVRRLSDSEDRIPVMVSERLLVRTTVMKRNITGLSFLYLQEN